MYRFSMYVTMTLLGLACYACDSPMEVAAEASAHPADGTDTAAARSNPGTEASPDRAGAARSDRPKGRLYPLPGEGGVAQSGDDSEQADEEDEETLSGTLNLNSASLEELDLLPGVGPAIAERIDSYRSKRRFEAIDDLKRVRGIGDATFAEMKPYVSVSGETTLSE